MVYNARKARIASFVRRGAMRSKAVPLGADVVGLGDGPDVGGNQNRTVSE
jgi:hypothetical protein